jgi:hypothetical protein
MRPTLATLPVELLTAIAYELAVANQPEPSPPTDLIPLLLASSYFYNHLSLEHNTPLYARILHATWDTAACSRRFGRDVLRDSRVAAEDLRARWVLVQGVKTRGALGFPGELGSEEQRELVRQDLVAIYLLLTENGTLRSPLARLLPRAVASVPRLTSMWLRVCIDGRNLPIVLLWAYVQDSPYRLCLQRNWRARFADLPCAFSSLPGGYTETYLSTSSETTSSTCSQPPSPLGIPLTR